MIGYLNSMSDLNLSCAMDYSEQEFYTKLVYKLKKSVGTNNVVVQFIKIIY